MVQIKKGTANILEFKVDINTNITNVVCLWKPRMDKQKWLLLPELQTSDGG